MMLESIDLSKKKENIGNSFFSTLSTRIINPLFLLRKLIGDRDSFSVENRVFNALCLITISSCLIAFYWNNSIGITPFLNLILGIFLLYYVVLYYYARFKKVFNSWYYVIPALIALSFIWFGSEGSRGSAPIIYIIAIIAFIAISKSRYHLTYLILTTLNIILLFVLENLFYDELIATYPTSGAREIDLIFSYGASFIVSYILISHFKRNYDKENDIIIKQKKELQELNATKDKFFSIIAHDLRSPLNSILGLSRVMADKSSNYTMEEMQQMVAMMNETADNSYRLLENLLSWARIQQGIIPFQPVVTRLKPIVSESIETVKGISSKKEIEISYNIPEAIKVFADKNMLKGVIRNLASNAVKFTNRGGSVIISARISAKTKVEVSVKDTGIGMNMEMINNLFRIDAQTNRKGTDGEPSTGLGLLLCKEFVEKLGGEIWVESKVDEGSIFKFTLPT